MQAKYIALSASLPSRLNKCYKNLQNFAEVKKNSCKLTKVFCIILKVFVTFYFILHVQAAFIAGQASVCHSTQCLAHLCVLSLIHI